MFVVGAAVAIYAPGRDSENAILAPAGSLVPVRVGESSAAVAPDELPALEGNLTTRNASGRSGAFFLPRRAARAPIPVLVALHGQGSDGPAMIPAFRELASTRVFAIIAPSSNYVPEMQTMTWRVGDHPNDVTDDYLHVQACFEEVASRAS
jgi:poly(3-hydroxybutyrate) depolymerase